MPPSVRYRELARRVNVLERRLPRVNPTGEYSSKQYDSVLAFRLLAHAEVEACIEDLARNALLGAFRAYKLDGRARLPLLAVASFSAAGKPGGVVAEGDADFGHWLGLAVTAHGKRIADNNGIRERNIAALLLPVGIQLPEIDPLWLAEIDAFGHRRGDAAHRSWGTQQPPDPVSEKSSIRFVVTGLRAIDSRLSDLAK